MATVKIKPKKATSIISSRHLKILAAKRSDLKDAVVFVCFDEEKYGCADISQLRKTIEEIDKVEPDGIYFGTVKNYDISIYDKSSVKNKDIVITIGRTELTSGVELTVFQEIFEKAFSGARSVTLVDCPTRKIEI